MQNIYKVQVYATIAVHTEIGCFRTSILSITDETAFNLAYPFANTREE